MLKKKTSLASRWLRDNQAFKTTQSCAFTFPFTTERRVYYAILDKSQTAGWLIYTTGTIGLRNSECPSCLTVNVTQSVDWHTTWSTTARFHQVSQQLLAKWKLIILYRSIMALSLASGVYSARWSILSNPSPVKKSPELYIGHWWLVACSLLEADLRAAWAECHLNCKWRTAEMYHKSKLNCTISFACRFRFAGTGIQQRGSANEISNLYSKSESWYSLRRWWFEWLARCRYSVISRLWPHSRDELKKNY